MKQTTLLNFLPKSLQKTQVVKSTDNEKINLNVTGNIELNKVLKQKSLLEIIEAQEKYENILDILGNGWFKDTDGFGFIDKDKIMIASILSDFNIYFFNIYNIDDFKIIKPELLIFDKLSNEKDKYLEIQGIEYKQYYLLKSLELLERSFQVWQHEKLKLLFLKNQDYGILICPKF